MLISIAAHVTADGNSRKAVGESEGALVAAQFLGNGAVGFCIADEAADCAAALNAVAFLSGIISRLRSYAAGEQSSVEAVCGGVNISAAICDKRIEARCADECAGGRVVIFIFYVVIFIFYKVAALDNGVDNAQSINRCIDIAEHTHEVVFTESGRVSGVEVATQVIL